MIFLQSLVVSVIIYPSHRTDSNKIKYALNGFIYLIAINTFKIVEQTTKFNVMNIYIYIYNGDYIFRVKVGVI